MVFQNGTLPLGGVEGNNLKKISVRHNKRYMKEGGGVVVFCKTDVKNDSRSAERSDNRKLPADPNSRGVSARINRFLFVGTSNIRPFSGALNINEELRMPPPARGSGFGPT